MHLRMDGWMDMGMGSVGQGAEEEMRVAFDTGIFVGNSRRTQQRRSRRAGHQG